MSTSSSRRPATIADWLAAPDELGLELIDGELVPKASPGFDHGASQAGTAAALRTAFNRRPGGVRFPGGWWIGLEVDIWIADRGLRPDLAGWRRERVPEPIKERPVTVRPDWIGEIVSESNRKHDTVRKLRWYHQAGVPHYWILDGDDRTLTVHRHHPDGYIIVLRAGADERVRAEPFDAIELKVGVLLGDDPDDE
ncbi:MAG TPA: Uma2 family endonuclease [Kofleriaceae bacterium]|nr:Uma2 family endonuclease [Kofleriaceae bacterium]